MYGDREGLDDRGKEMKGRRKGEEGVRGTRGGGKVLLRGAVRAHGCGAVKRTKAGLYACVWYGTVVR